MNKYYIQNILGAYLKSLGHALGYPNFQICSIFAEYLLFKPLIHITYHIYEF